METTLASSIPWRTKEKTNPGPTTLVITVAPSGVQFPEGKNWAKQLNAESFPCKTPRDQDSYFIQHMKDYGGKSQ
ncbi:hypothetical protein SDJN02_14060, partial [Cucurbita argyrosperma subsp. argyrosperma]